MIYRAVFHFDLDDERLLRIGLSNAANLLKAIRGQHADVVMIFNGPAVRLLSRPQAEGYQQEIAALAAARVSFQVCRNALLHFEIEEASLIEGFEVIPAGVLALIRLQQDGYAYIKP